MQQSFYDTPLTYKGYTDKISSLKKEYPFLRLFPIGKSVLGRKIYALGLGNLKRCNLFAGAFHAQEWLTAMLIIMFIEQVSKSIKDCDSAVKESYGEMLSQKGLLAVPLVNPDGVEIAVNGIDSALQLKSFVKKTSLLSDRSWQANARGIDLNHNFNAGFFKAKAMVAQSGITSPAPRRFGGEVPHSEPEVKALTNLCFNFNISTAFAFHSQGEEIYYEYDKYTPAISEYIAKLLASYCSYRVCLPETIASHAGFKDWFIKTFARPAFTFEVGKGVNPLPLSDLGDIYRKLEEALIIASVI